METCMNSIVELVFRYAEQTPDHIALIAEGEMITYGQMKKYICSGIKYLESTGIKKGDRILIKAFPSISYFAVMFSIHLMGAVCVPVEKTLKAAGIASLQDRLKVQAVIMDAVEGMPEDWYIIDDIWDEIINGQSDPVRQTEKIYFPRGDEIGEILFTTGTTGKSKGVVLSHKNMMANAENVLGFTHIDAGNVNLIPAPMNHAYGLRRSYANFYVGGTVVLLDGISSLKKFYDAIEKYNVNALSMVSTMFEFLFRMTKDKLGDYKEQIKNVDLGAQYLSLEVKNKLIELLPNAKLYNIFGSSEAGCCTGFEFSQNISKRDSIGKDAVNAKIRFMNDDMQFVDAKDIDTAGYISIDGSMVMQGYFDDAELTAQSLQDRTLLTNDIGYRDQEGYIYLIGRKDDVINIGGNKIAPTEVEDIAKLFNGVEDCACVAFHDEKSVIKVVPKLFVVTDHEEDFSFEDMTEHLSNHLEQYKIPKIFQFIDSIPRSFNGKILRNKLI